MEEAILCDNHREMKTPPFKIKKTNACSHWLSPNASPSTINGADLLQLPLRGRSESVPSSLIRQPVNLCVHLKPLPSFPCPYLLATNSGGAWLKPQTVEHLCRGSFSPPVCSIEMAEICWGKIKKNKKHFRGFMVLQSA